MTQRMLSRGEGLLDEQKSRRTHIVFIGLGSGGSYGLVHLPYQFGRVDLVDPDNLEPQNIERHMLDNRYLGRPKVEAMKEAMSYRNIDADTIFTHVCRAEDMLHTIPKPDILVVGIDDPESQRYINAWCVENNVFALYPGVYPRGTGGQVIVVPNPQDTCLECALVLMGMTATEKPSGSGAHNYGLDIQIAEKATAVPCLNWAIASIATEVARYVVQFVNGEEIKPHVFVRVHDSREILRISSDTIGVISDFIMSQNRLGILPLFSMEANGAVILHHGQASYVLPRWDRCPHHGTTQKFSLKDI